MISRRIFAAFALLCTLIIPAHAQTGSPKTSAQLNAEVNARIPSNGRQQVTAFDLRQVWLDFISSVFPDAPDYYVATNGSDGNSCITSSLPCLTLQGAWNKIAVANHGSGGATLHLADGIYVGPLVINGTSTGAGPISAVGNCTTPGNVIINPTSGVSAITVLNAKISLSCFGLITSGGGAQLIAGAGAEVSISNMKFGDALGGGDQMFVTDGGLIMLSGNYTVGGAFGSHMHFRRGGRVMLPTGGNLTATLVGTPAATNYFIGGNAAFADLNGITWAGSTATGPKFFLHNGARLNTGTGGNLAWLPASTAGLFDSWAQYDDIASGIFGLSAGAPLAPDALYTANGNSAASAALSFSAQFHAVGANGGFAGYASDAYGAGINLDIGRLAFGTATAPLPVSAPAFVKTWGGQSLDSSGSYGNNCAIDIAASGAGGGGQTATDHGGFMRGRCTVPGTAGPMVEVWRASKGFMIGGTGDGGAATLTLHPQTFASLTACSSTIEGAMAAITDSSTNTWGATITGGSTNHVKGYCNGTNWTVDAK